MFEKGKAKGVSATRTNRRPHSGLGGWGVTVVALATWPAFAALLRGTARASHPPRAGGRYRDDPALKARGAPAAAVAVAILPAPGPSRGSAARAQLSGCGLEGEPAGGGCAQSVRGGNLKRSYHDDLWGVFGNPAAGPREEAVIRFVITPVALLLSARLSALDRHVPALRSLVLSCCCC